MLGFTFIIGSAVIVGGMVEMTDNPLTKRTCFVDYTDCNYDKIAETSNNNAIPQPIQLAIGFTLIIGMFVCLRYNKQRFINLGDNR